MIPEPCRIVQFFSVLAHIIHENLSIWAKNPMIFRHSGPGPLIRAGSEPGGTESRLLRESNRRPQRMKRENVCLTD